MPRRPRFAPPDVPVHIVHRGNDRGATFRDASDYVRYRAALDEGRLRAGCAIHAYVLMTNHVHVLATPGHATAVSEMMQTVGRRYVRYFNDRYGRSGTLWEGRFRSTPIDSERYFFSCARYIELNPVRAGMVRHPREYRWSSFRVNAENTAEPLIAPHPLYEALGRDHRERAAAYRDLFARSIDGAVLDLIRRATNSGLPLL